MTPRSKRYRLLWEISRNKSGDYYYHELTRLGGFRNDTKTRIAIDYLGKKGFIRPMNCKCICKKDIYIKLTLAGRTLLDTLKTPIKPA